MKGSEDYGIECIEGPQKIHFKEHGIYSSQGGSFKLEYKNFSKGPNDEICPIWYKNVSPTEKTLKLFSPKCCLKILYKNKS